jgi:large subunit ribosomal protein L10
MKREDKKVIIQELTEKLNRYDHFYLADISELDAADTSLLRRKCFDKSINLVVVKNTLLRKALEQSEKNFEDLYDVLKDSTSVMFSDTGNVPAKLIKEFRKTHERPCLRLLTLNSPFTLAITRLTFSRSLSRVMN